jgi:hypothetical protein
LDIIGSEEQQVKREERPEYPFTSNKPLSNQDRAAVEDLVQKMNYHRQAAEVTAGAEMDNHLRLRKMYNHQLIELQARLGTRIVPTYAVGRDLVPAVLNHAKQGHAFIENPAAVLKTGDIISTVTNTSVDFGRVTNVLNNSVEATMASTGGTTTHYIEHSLFFRSKEVLIPSEATVLDRSILMARAEVRTNPAISTIVDEQGARSLVDKENLVNVSLVDKYLIYRKNTGPDIEDFQFMASNGLRESQIVTDKKLFKFIQPTAGWTPVVVAAITVEYAAVYSEVFKQLQSEINAGDISIEEANSEIYSRIWKKISKKTGLDFFFGD